MNPYARFGLVSNSVSAAIVVGALAVAGPQIFSAITSAAGPGPAMWGALAGAVTVLVVFWLTLTEAIFPVLFRFNSVRKFVLGKYYIEGTWLQAEKGDGVARMAVIDIQPSGKSFIFSGYALNQDLEIESNALIEFSKFEWPFMTYKYRNTLSDGADGQREGVGEIQFEMNSDSARRYNGYVQHVKNAIRLKIEGTKLTRGSEVRKLRSLQGREEVFGKYWDLFFNRGLRREVEIAARTAAASSADVRRTRKAEVRPADLRPAAPVEISREEHEAAVVERRARVEAQKAELGETVIPRRRVSDWSELEVEAAADVSGSDTIVARRASDTAAPAAESPAKSVANGTDYRNRPVL